MADQFGAVPLPVPTAAEGFPVSDPALRYLADFFQAVVNADVGDAWDEVSPENLPVVTALTHNPEKANVSDKEFPAVFVWGPPPGPPTREADDFYTRHRRIEILWCFEPSTQDKHHDRASGVNGVINAFLAAFELGRHPAWALDGDPDVRAETRGSAIKKLCGFARENVLSPTESGLTIELYDGDTKLREYEAVKLTIEAVETFTRDPAVWGKASALSHTTTQSESNELEFQDPPEDP